jgi:hypothetical protein
MLFAEAAIFLQSILTLHFQKIVILPWTADVLISGLSWLPRPVFYRLCALFGVTTSMTGWKGHAAKAKL